MHTYDRMNTAKYTVGIVVILYTFRLAKTTYLFIAAYGGGTRE